MKKYRAITPKSRIRLSEPWKWNFRHYSYRDLVAGKRRGVMGWGVMLSGNLQPVDKIILYFQAAYGKGIGAYLQDIAGKPLSFIPDDAHPGKMKASPMLDANIGISYNPTSRLQFNAMFSESRIWEVGDYCNAIPETENYKYALYGAVNCFYNITSYLQWGIEYLYGRRVTWNAGGANDSRIQTQLPHYRRQHRRNRPPRHELQPLRPLHLQRQGSEDARLYRL